MMTTATENLRTERPLRLLAAAGILLTALAVMVGSPTLEDWRSKPGQRLITAAANGNVDALRTELGNRSGVKKQDLEDALRIATMSGSVRIVEELLARGVDPDARGPSWVTPLMVIHPDDECEMARRLIAAGADVNAADGRTPLLDAVTGTRPALVKLLLAAGADVNARDRYGRTVFSEAMRIGDAEVIGLLKKVEIGPLARAK